MIKKLFKYFLLKSWVNHLKTDHAVAGCPWCHMKPSMQIEFWSTYK